MIIASCTRASARAQNPRAHRAHEREPPAAPLSQACHPAFACTHASMFPFSPRLQSITRRMHRFASLGAGLPPSSPAADRSAVVMSSRRRGEPTKRTSPHVPSTALGGLHRAPPAAGRRVLLPPRRPWAHVRSFELASPCILPFARSLTLSLRCSSSCSCNVGMSVWIHQKVATRDFTFFFSPRPPRARALARLLTRALSSLFVSRRVFRSGMELDHGSEANVPEKRTAEQLCPCP